MSNVNATFLGGHNDKAGVPVDGKNRSQIDEIIREASKGSKFYTFQQKREQKILEKIAILRRRKEQIEKDPPLLQRVKHETQIWIKEMESKRNLENTVVHIDMDAFFAAVEILRRPELANVPLAVGGDSMLCTASYEARKYGISSAMPGYIAKKLCKDLVLIPPDYSAYRAASDKVHKVLTEYDPNFTSFSLDEASINITDYLKLKNIESAEGVVNELRERVFKSTGLTCSAGIAANRQLAKMCSNVNKPNGQFMLSPDKEEILTFVGAQPAKKISGVGKVTAKILEDLLNIKTCKEIIDQAIWIRLLFSEIQSEFLLKSALGLGSTFGEDLGSTWERKSISCETTFKRISGLDVMLEELQKLATRLSEDMTNRDLAGKTITVKFKTSDFDVQTRAVTLDTPIWSVEDIYHHGSIILQKHKPKDLRLLGLRMSSIMDRDEAEELWGKYKPIDLFCKESSVKPECPICMSIIDAHQDDTFRINEHIDKCINPDDSIKSGSASVTIQSRVMAMGPGSTKGGNDRPKSNSESSAFSL